MSLKYEPSSVHCPLSSQYRGTSLIRNSALLGPYSKTMPRALWWFWGYPCTGRLRNTLASPEPLELLGGSGYMARIAARRLVFGIRVQFLNQSLVSKLYRMIEFLESSVSKAELSFETLQDDPGLQTLIRGVYELQKSKPGSDSRFGILEPYSLIGVGQRLMRSHLLL